MLIQNKLLISTQMNLFPDERNKASSFPSLLEYLLERVKKVERALLSGQFNSCLSLVLIRLR